MMATEQPEPLSPAEVVETLRDQDPNRMAAAVAALGDQPHDGLTCPRSGCGEPVPMDSLWLFRGLLYCSYECGRAVSW